MLKTSCQGCVSLFIIHTASLRLVIHTNPVSYRYFRYTMIYRISFPDAVLQFRGNQGQLSISADSPEAALTVARAYFGQMRDERVQPNGDEGWLVTFRASYDYKPGLIREIDRAVRLLGSARFYASGRYLDRYIVASIGLATGKPVWLREHVPSLNEEVSSLRTSAIIAREVANLDRFIDWDICIANYVELNNKDGHRSRVVRPVR